jgi:hypothetical protein
MEVRSVFSKIMEVSNLLGAIDGDIKPLTARAVEVGYEDPAASTTVAP